MKNISTVIAASALAVVGAQANAALDFASTTTIDGPALTVSGGGVGTGSGSFGAASLTINSVVTTQTNLTGAATLTTTSVYNGTIVGSTFTADGTGSSVTACTGDAQVCGSAAGTATFTAGDLFSVDTVTGGSWTSTGTQYNGIISTVTVSTLSAAVPVPAAAWLFGSALIGLAGVGRKRKMA